ncbi:MAG: hypothetical protein Q9188_005356 [Gyalolechia gomerana]
MEGLVAVGLAANIVQLVDAAAKAFNVCHEFYSLGASIDDSRMAITSKELSKSYADMVSESKPDNNKVCGVEIRPWVDKHLHSPAILLVGDLRCMVAGHFADAAFLLKKDSLNRNASTSHTILRSGVDLTELSLRESLGNWRVEQHGETTRLEQQLSQMSASLMTCHLPISNQLKSEIERAITANKEQLASAMHDLEIAQERRRQYDQFLESLRFSEMNFRMNDVSSSHPGTFEWMFDDTTERPWNSFTKWLRAGDGIYWVHGKAGSGKTTLMKFLADDPRTRDLLEQSSRNNKTLIATFYFWLSGSKPQRSLGGFLRSLLYQVMLENKSLFDCLCVDKTILAKRGMHDWSELELQKLLMQSIAILAGPICIFVDGLDEFDQADNVDNLINLIEILSSLSEVKVCVSSRPENQIVKRLSKYSQVRLQDLTAADIRLCIRDSLHDARTRCSPTTVDEERLGDIVEVMTEKADGVFLWVHYALSSLIRGMRNEDDFEDLLDRIEELPRGMSQLYSQMWNRLNEDEQRYRDEAATYFSYESFFPLSVFELLVALDETLQDRYRVSLESQNEVGLAERCQRLTTRILTRCAGMLEIVPNRGSHRSTKSTREHDRSDDSNSENDQIDKCARERVKSISRSVARTGPPAIGDRTDEEMNPKDTLDFHHESKIKFLHRTARDFLHTIDGKIIIGEPVDSLEIRFQNVVRAQIAAGIQGLTDFDAVWVRNIISSIGAFETHYETELLLILKRACEHLSIPNQPLRHMNYRNFWTYPGGDFECKAAFYGCMKYIRHVVLHENLYISPYYRGLLLLFAAEGLNENPARHLALISWLYSAGADILTNHVYSHIIMNPASVFLSGICRPNIRDTPSLAGQTANILQNFLPEICDSASKCVLWLKRNEDWRVDRLSLVEAFGSPTSVLAQMTIAKLFFLARRYFNDQLASDLQWSCLTLDEKHVTKVVLLETTEMGEEGPCPSSEDSVYLGEAFDDVLFCDETSSSSLDATSSSSLDATTKVFAARLAEVQKRSPIKNFVTWELEAGWSVDWDRLTERTLDPAEDVDESNWMERGHFEKREDYAASQLSCSQSSVMEGSIATRSDSDDQRVSEVKEED